VIIQFPEIILTFREGKGYYPIYVKKFKPYIPPPYRAVALYPIVLENAFDELRNKAMEICNDIVRVLRVTYDLHVIIKKDEPIIVDDRNLHNTIEKLIDIKNTCLKEEKQWNRLPIMLVFGRRTPRWYKMSPYYALKMICRDSIVSQYVTETVLDNYKMSIENIALAIFTKLGGIPWVPSTQPRSDIVIGVATTMVRIYEKGLPIDARYIGAFSIYRYTTYPVFKDFMSIVFEDKEEFRERFGELLYESLTSLAQEIIREGKEKFTVTIHYSGKRPSKSEVETVKGVLDVLPIQAYYTVVTVGDDTIYRVFSPAYDYYPPKSCLIKLSNREGILTTGGAIIINDKTYYHPVGMPRCLKVDVVDTNINEERVLHEVAKDILVLTRLHWHTMSTRIREPISTRYTRRLAFLVASLQYLSAKIVEKWKELQVPKVMKSSRLWFI